MPIFEIRKIGRKDRQTSIEAAAAAATTTQNNN